MADDERAPVTAAKELQRHGASGARRFFGKARGHGVNQDEWLGQISFGGRLHFDSLREIGNCDDTAAGCANPAFVRRVRQLLLAIRGLLAKLCSSLLLFMVMRHNRGICHMVMVISRFYVCSLGIMTCSHTAIQHGCRSKALQRQGQHHQAKQQVAKTRHRRMIL